MPSIEVEWTRRGEDREKTHYKAHRVGDEWRFFTRAKRFDDWELLAEPTLDDWLEVLDGVRRRKGRGMAREKDEAQLVERIRRLFPGERI